MVDVNAQIDAVTRGVQTTELDGEPSRVQTLSQVYPSPIDDVWDAVTSAERIARWFLPVAGDLRVGGRYQLEGNAGGEVLECSPPAGGSAGYRVTWEFGGGVPGWRSRCVPSTTRRPSSSSLTSRGRRPACRVLGAVRTRSDGRRLGSGPAGARAAPPRRRPDAARRGRSVDGRRGGQRFARGAADAWAAAQVAAGEDADAAAARGRCDLRVLHRADAGGVSDRRGRPTGPT